jgi:hypothetical protein
VDFGSIVLLGPAGISSVTWSAENYDETKDIVQSNIGHTVCSVMINEDKPSQGRGKK